MHTPRKAGRIVVFFIKKIWAHINNSLVACELQLTSNFSRFEARPSRVIGGWLGEEQIYELKHLGAQGFGVELICRPGFDLGPRLVLEAKEPPCTPLTVVVTRLEALVPLLKAFAHDKLLAGTVIILNLSQMSSNIEQAGVLLEEKALKAHQRALAQVFIELKALGPSLGLDLLIFDQPELLGHKNSALFERLFLSKPRANKL